MLTANQQQDRQGGIGGSDAPAVLNVSPFKSRMQLWLEMTGQAVPPDISGEQHVEAGNRLEPVAGKWFSDLTGIPIRRWRRQVRHPRHAWQRGFIDFRVTGAPELVEVKTLRGLDGDAPRADHVAQCLHYLLVTGWRRAWLVYLVGGQRLLWFPIERDEGEIEKLAQAEAEFYRCVQDRTPPLATCAHDLRLLHPRDAGTSVVATDATLAAVEALARLRQEAKTLEERQEGQERLILEQMGEAAELLAPDGRVLATWRSAKPSRTFDRAKFESEHPELAPAYMVERPGARRFLLKVGA